RTRQGRVGNFAGGGGGIYIHGAGLAFLNVNDSVISRNASALFGGGIDSAARVTLINSIIGRNTAVSEGAGIATSGSGSLLTLTNTYIVENTGGKEGYAGLENGGDPVSSSHVVIADNFPDDCGPT